MSSLDERIYERIYDPDTEAIVLLDIFIYPNREKLLNKLKGDDFCRYRYREFFFAMARLHKAGIDFTPIEVIDEVRPKDADDRALWSHTMKGMLHMADIEGYLLECRLIDEIGIERFLKIKLPEFHIKLLKQVGTRRFWVSKLVSITEKALDDQDIQYDLSILRASPPRHG